jgi:hypothetical protein
MMHMSKQGLYDQLTSEYGEQFSADAAQYAIDNVQADWKQNALEKARIVPGRHGDVAECRNPRPADKRIR